MRISFWPFRGDAFFQGTPNIKPATAPRRRDVRFACDNGYGGPVYDALAVMLGFPFCFNAAISAMAAGPEECGFCPVVRRPSVTT